MERQRKTALKNEILLAQNSVILRVRSCARPRLKLRDWSGTPQACSEAKRRNGGESRNHAKPDGRERSETKPLPEAPENIWRKKIMRLSKLGICGIISLVSYSAMVIFSPLAYPGYNWLSMAVSELSAVGAPSKELAGQLNALFGPCAIVSIMAVCVAVAKSGSRILKIGIYLFAAMEWCCNVGYECFPWLSGSSALSFQNIMHIAVTVAGVALSVASLILIAAGAKKDNRKTIEIWAIICLAAMIGGAAGTNLLPKTVFGIAERISTFSAVVFNAVLGIELLRRKLD